MRPFVFPFSQHIGAPSVPVVQPGDRVQRGQCIAEAGEGLGSPIYTSVSGMVLEVTGNAVIVRADDVQPKDYVPLTAQAPLECIRQAGIVGLGGAGFPTYQKLAVPFSHGGVVIANASECEPILNHNIDALEKDCRPMIRGLQLAMELVHADKGVIAIKAIHGKAVRALQQAIAGDDRLALVGLQLPGEDAEEGALPRAVAAQQAHPLPLVDLEGDAVQYILPDLKGLYQSLSLNIDHSSAPGLPPAGRSASRGRP